MQRRLAAIVHADLAGFTRMMEGAETRTFRHLKSAQIEVWRPAIDAVVEVDVGMHVRKRGAVVNQAADGDSAAARRGVQEAWLRRRGGVRRGYQAPG